MPPKQHYNATVTTTERNAVRKQGARTSCCPLLLPISGSSIIIVPPRWCPPCASSSCCRRRSVAALSPQSLLPPLMRRTPLSKWVTPLPKLLPSMVGAKIEGKKIVTSVYTTPMALHLYISPHFCHAPGVLSGMVWGSFLNIHLLCS